MQSKVKRMNNQLCFTLSPEGPILDFVRVSTCGAQSSTAGIRPWWTMEPPLYALTGHTKDSQLHI